MLSSDDANEILSQFPKVESAFAYGSGVVQQASYDYKNGEFPMLDLIFVVDNAEEWHRENIAINSSHYAFGVPHNAKYIACIQDKFQAYMWFNTSVPMQSTSFPGRKMKYGVISKRRLLQDLLSWKSLYVAGRLHKPVMILKSSNEIDTAMFLNRVHAMRVALLLLPPTFNDIQLFTTIAGLSYGGDPRMLFAENPNKVNNLVSPIVPHYKALYEPAIKEIVSLYGLNTNLFDRSDHDSSVKGRSSSGCGMNSPDSLDSTGTGQYHYEFNINTSSQKVPHLNNIYSDLPAYLKTQLSIGQAESSKDESLPVSVSISTPRPPSAAAVSTALAAIVSRAARGQTIKGLFTAGLSKGFSYVIAKIGKRFKKS